MRQICEKVRLLAGSRLGLDLSRSEDDHLLGKVREAAARWDMSASEYLDLLDSEPVGAKVWGSLVEGLTIAETYFFRDQGQMSLLQQTLLPGLISSAEGRPLRIWSAGCSTGEEIYSIAMILDQLGALPAELFGTDINLAILEQARQGLCRERAVRNLPDHYRQRYFESLSDRFLRLNPDLKRNVTFHWHNLADPPSTFLRGLDLVICRNVLIYFERERLSEVLGGFFSSLRPGGVLLTGHGEVMVAAENPFESEMHSQSVVFRKPRSQPPMFPAALSAKAPEERPDVSTPRLTSHPSPRNYVEMARLCRKGGRDDEARELLSKALYLDLEYGEAYLELALVTQPTEPERARRHRSTALALLARSGLEGWSKPEVQESLRELERKLP